MTILKYIILILIATACTEPDTAQPVIKQAINVQPYIDSVNYYRDVIESDIYLKQHFYAVLYQDSIITWKEGNKRRYNFEMIIRFMRTLELRSPDISIGTALKETGMYLGTAEYGNLHGFKRARSRFSWAHDYSPSNYQMHENNNPWFSFLEMDYYLSKGGRPWSSYDIPDTVRILIDRYWN